MQKNYSQLTALMAISKATLLAIVKNPGSLFFSLVFPLVFVWIFGSFGSSGGSRYRIALEKNSDTSNILYTQLKNLSLLQIKNYSDTVLQRADLEKGRLAAVLQLSQTKNDSTHQPHFTIKLTSTSASSVEIMQLIPILENLSANLEKSMNPNSVSLVSIEKNIYSVRAYKQIDFVLPGQIGFSILFSTLFGIAFTFYNLREQLVLKRFYASPVNRLNILLGVGFSRLVFQLINVVVLIVVGKFFLGFTLAHGIITFVEMVGLSILMLFVLMGVGLIFSSIVKSDATIPLLINVFALPQMLLSGTFFSITVFPEWMQLLCKFLPLTHFNLAMRKISFEGASIFSCWQNIGVIGLWGISIYLIVYKIFRWE
ncbi:MAG: ABC transporter permease [Chitinophagaceae bacterium]|nr:ABC transporter permease [Chitinophagaceae bacterium]